MADAVGDFSFVLHSHIPYCRKAGRWPHGEEWIHEAASETYLPLLEGLARLNEDGVRFGLTIGLTPVLCEQLADADVANNLALFMQDKLERASADIARFERDGDGGRAAAASWYHQRYTDLLARFERLDRNILSGFKWLQDRGCIEIATSAATHGYLPLMARDSTLYAQFAVGCESYLRHFGRDPRSCWLPECAYRPAYVQPVDSTSYVKPGIQSFMAEHGLNLFFVETHTIEGGAPVGKAVGDAVGPYGSVPRRYVVPASLYGSATLRTTFEPYWVETHEVAAMARNSRTGLQVWSASHGYPGDFQYREFHKRDGVSGLHYWRVSGADVDLADKQVWNPLAAAERVAVHAAHFATLVEDELSAFRRQHGHGGIIAAAYDTELFGHWWFEGVDWLPDVLRRLAARDSVALSSAGDYLLAHPPTEVLSLPESSWGQAGNHFTWLNADTEWMWPIIHAAERRMERLVALHPRPVEPARSVLNQCARELLLLESSDWPFLVTTGQAREYAIDRFESHVERFERLATCCEQRGLTQHAVDQAAALWELDKVFPGMDYRVFAAREAVAT